MFNVFRLYVLMSGLLHMSTLCYHLRFKPPEDGLHVYHASCSM